MRLLDGRKGRRFLVGHMSATARRRGKRLTTELAATDVDVVVAVAASQEIAHLGGGVPVIHVSDATFAAVQDFYPLYSSLHRSARRQGESIERRALGRAAFAAMPSEWARSSAVTDYGVPAAKVRVVPFGPRVATTGARRRAGNSSELRILLVASDWQRKGGEAALTAVSSMVTGGHRVALTVVGDHPDMLPAWACGRGRLYPTEMGQLYADHDVLLELATANATGVTLTDAAHAGLPVVAARTGGVATVVEDGVTGFLVTPGEAMVAQAVEALAAMTDPDLRASFSQAARQRAADLLNWDQWADSIVALAREALTR
ncbi:glycosyltransferase family 4 protein [Ornithinimicrobium sp. Y1847]|uniref:glycosyltransferase family 4 protein n=1 Tax=Ornithinimicrobium sp. Y1847 TaxID=3405419 RepID=UPI003B674BCB